MWRREYDRVCSQKIKHKHDNFEEERMLFNNLYREEQGQTSTENSQLWVVQNSQAESDTHNE